MTKDERATRLHHEKELAKLDRKLDAMTPAAPAPVEVAELVAKLRYAGREFSPDSLYYKAAALIERLAAEKAEAERLHRELLYAVAQKHPDETRHQTALRYIRQREEAGRNDANAGQVDAARAPKDA